jgi:dipeptidyl aminopeptidase/acylaminoacyl peptidase
MFHPARVAIPKDEAARAREDVPGLEDATLRTADGLALHGWYAPGTRHAVVILVHGGRGNRLQLFPEARLFARHGYGVLVYDSRAAGESDGDVVTWGDLEQRDVTAALDYVGARPEIDKERVCVLGFSIGGSTALLAAARDTRARALILYATWTSLQDEIRTNYNKHGLLTWGPATLALHLTGLDLHNVRPIDHVREISPRPLLMITGSRDDDTPVPVMEELYAMAGEPKQLWIVPGADHGGYFSTAPAEYEARVIAFLDQTIGKDPGSRSTSPD